MYALGFKYNYMKYNKVYKLILSTRQFCLKVEEPCLNANLFQIIQPGSISYKLCFKCAIKSLGNILIEPKSAETEM